MNQEELITNLYHGLYDPRRIYIQINLPHFAIIDDNDKLRPATLKSWGILIHEYFHYLQNISSPVGVTLFNNWISAQMDIAKVFARTEKLTFPLEQITDSTVTSFLAGAKSIIDEIRLVYNTRSPLTISSEPLSSSWKLIDKTVSYRGNPQSIPLKHILVPDSGKCFEVPLIPSAFAEGMAKMIQWYVETDGRWNDQLLFGYPVKEPYIYYSVIARWVRTHFPKADPFWLTVVICDTCLCSYDPGHAFDLINQFLIQNPSDFKRVEDYLSLRRKLQLLWPFRTELNKALSHISDLDLQLSPAGPKEAAFDMRRIISRMKNALIARLTDPEHFIFLDKPENIFSHFRDIYGVPATAIGQDEEEMTLFDFVGDQDFIRSCMLLMAIHHIFDTTLSHSQIGKCPYYPNQCRAPKGNYCTENPLWAPIEDGRGCPMAYAAFTLNATQKGPKPSNQLL